MAPSPDDELPCLKAVGAACELQIQVVPNASRTQVAGLHDGALRIRLMAPPIEGRANAALLAWLAAWCGQLVLTAVACPPWLTWVLAAGIGAVLAGLWPDLSAWRRGLMAGGFPVSALASGAPAIAP